MFILVLSTRTLSSQQSSGVLPKMPASPPAQEGKGGEAISPHKQRELVAREKDLIQGMSIGMSIGRGSSQLNTAGRSCPCEDQSNSRANLFQELCIRCTSRSTPSISAFVLPLCLIDASQVANVLACVARRESKLSVANSPCGHVGG